MSYPTNYIFIAIWIAMIALAFVEGYVEGRNPWTSFAFCATKSESEPVPQ